MRLPEIDGEPPHRTRAGSTAHADGDGAGAVRVAVAGRDGPGGRDRGGRAALALPVVFMYALAPASAARSAAVLLFARHWANVAPPSMTSPTIAMIADGGQGEQDEDLACLHPADEDLPRVPLETSIHGIVTCRWMMFNFRWSIRKSDGYRVVVTVTMHHRKCMASGG